MPPSLGGSLFVHDAIRFDYCIAEAVASLCAVCDEVVCIDAESTDGTSDILADCRRRHPNLRVEWARWEQAENFHRLRILADLATGSLRTDWVFMGQADEVLHEDSFPALRQAIETSGWQSYMVRRVNLWGDCGHQLRYDMPHRLKPCNDLVVRLATAGHRTHHSAENLGCDPRYLCHAFADRLCLVHYGFVRRGPALLAKQLEMQAWHRGPGSDVDPRVLAMREAGTFRHEAIVGPQWCQPRTVSHPRFVRDWVAERGDLLARGGKG